MFFVMGIDLNMHNVIHKIVFGVCIVLAMFIKILTSQELPAMFVFGDSLVDVGNNNYITTLSRANYYPNGIDFGSPTGRFTNGRTIVDIIGEELGIGYQPAYLDPTTVLPGILHGVNYASGAGGILNLTGRIFGGRINFDAQLDNFENTRQNIISSIGVPAALDLLTRAIFSVTMGSNDFINNYLLASRYQRAPPEVYVDTLISRFRDQLTRLFNLGARKIVVANVGPIGCIPSQREMNIAFWDGCATLPNQLAQLFNTQLKSLAAELNANLKGSMFIYADVYRIFDDIFNNFITYGFENPSSSCCSLAGRFGGLIPCGLTSRVCPDRSKYVFWDPFHPTDAANVIIAKRLLDGDRDDVYPMNVRQLFHA